MMNVNDLIWAEKYRPQSIDSCILPERLMTLFKSIVKDKNVPNMILHGSAGVGKTTVARALCKDVGCDYLFINGSDENGIDTFRSKIKTYASSSSLLGGKKVVIIDEADYMNQHTLQPSLRAAIEEFAANCTFIFTCNYKERLIQPLHSRCSVVDFTLHKEERVFMAQEFYKNIKNVLTCENVKFDNKVLIEFVKTYFPDFRRTIVELQRYARCGEINTGILSNISTNSISECIDFIKNKDFRSLRKWVGTTSINMDTVYTQLYDLLYDIMKPHSIPQAVIILADYQYKHAFVGDKELNLVACLVELMGNCDFV